jgi:hypothetical protein
VEVDGVEGFTDVCIALPLIDDPTDIFDKYDEVVLLPAVVAAFIADFGDQLVMEYDFASVLAIFPSETDEPLAAEGATDTALPDVDWGVLAVDTLDKYDALLLPVVASFTSDFGDQFDIEYDLLIGVLITAFGDTTSAVVIEYCRYI